MHSLYKNLFDLNNTEQKWLELKVTEDVPLVSVVNVVIEDVPLVREVSVVIEDVPLANTL